MKSLYWARGRIGRKRFFRNYSKQKLKLRHSLPISRSIMQPFSNILLAYLSRSVVSTSRELKISRSMLCPWLASINNNINFKTTIFLYCLILYSCIFLFWVGVLSKWKIPSYIVQRIVFHIRDTNYYINYFNSLRTLSGETITINWVSQHVFHICFSCFRIRIRNVHIFLFQLYIAAHNTVKIYVSASLYRRVRNWIRIIKHDGLGSVWDGC